MADFTYGYICGGRAKGEVPFPGIIYPLYAIAESEAFDYMRSVHGEAYVWINWITEFEGIGIVLLQRAWKCRNGVITLLYDTEAWGNADPND
jgi:hypothetical protein